MSFIKDIIHKSTKSKRSLEAIIVKEVKKRDGIAIRLRPCFGQCLPSLMLLLPYHTMVIVEIKAPGKDVNPEKDRVIRALLGNKYSVRIIDNSNDLFSLLETLDRRIETKREEHINKTRKEI